MHNYFLCPQLGVRETSVFIKHARWVKRSYLNSRRPEPRLCPNLPMRPGEELGPPAAIQHGPSDVPKAGTYSLR